MAVIEVEINSKIYQLGCEDEDIPKIIGYVEILNQRINNLKKQDPSLFIALNDERLFLLEAITLIAEVVESNQNKQKDEENLKKSKDNYKTKIFHNDIKGESVGDANTGALEKDNANIMNLLQAVEDINSIDLEVEKINQKIKHIKNILE